MSILMKTNTSMKKIQRIMKKKQLQMKLPKKMKQMRYPTRIS